MASAASVLFVTRKWAPATGGMETYSVKLAAELASLCALEVVALRGRDDGMPPGLLRLLAFPFTFLAVWLRQSRKPQVLHLGDLALWPLGLLAGRATRLVISVHGTDIVYGLRQHWRGRAYSTYLALGRKLLPQPVMLANSAATAAALAKAGWPHARVIPLATDLAVSDVPGHREHEVLFAGRLIERKGCAWFIRNVLPLLPAQFHLKVIGPAWCADEVSATDDPRVTYRGQVPFAELVQAYGEAMCVVVPNIPVASHDYEGFGIIAPEAAAAGGVVLAARHGGLADAVIDGETGLLLPPGQAQVWADAILAVASWDGAHRKGFCNRARHRVAEQYNWARVARETLGAYQGQAR